MPFFMAEDYELCTYTKHHKQKILTFLLAMRHYRDQLQAQGYTVYYHELEAAHEHRNFTDKLREVVQKENIDQLLCFEIEDQFFEKRIKEFCRQQKIKLEIHSSPMFTCSRDEFREYLSTSKRPFMKTFYERQRRRLNILMEADEPLGGQFSYDAENRKKLPKGYEFLPTPSTTRSPHMKAVKDLVRGQFDSHPGTMEDFIWPVTREQALELLDDFFGKKLEFFGDYQDALTTEDPFVNHSLISTALNMGLLTPQDILARLSLVKTAPLNSLEGFIRQVLGWREFVRGMYHNFSKTMETTNHWQHRRRGKTQLYSGASGIAPLDDAIKKALKYGYCHHIERLMVLANFFNLCELQPSEVYGWFMNHFVDSSDWVMQANVYGMGLMSDGGLFATKPYISGSNYLRKMSNYKTGDWCTIWDGLYWRFVEQKKERIAKNPRMSMMVRMLEKMEPKKKRLIFTAADKFLDEFTESVI